MKPEAGVQIVEVGPRDGLQNLAIQVPADDKVRLIERLAASGLREIQIGAFVSPAAIPQFRDMREVAARVRDLAGVTHKIPASWEASPAAPPAGADGSTRHPGI